MQLGTYVDITLHYLKFRIVTILATTNLFKYTQFYLNIIYTKIIISFLNVQNYIAIYYKLQYLLLSFLQVFTSQKHIIDIVITCTVNSDIYIHIYYNKFYNFAIHYH